jgi:hypothetical protein
VGLANLGSKLETCVGSRVHLVGVSISFEKNFYRLPFTPPSLVRRLGPSLFNKLGGSDEELIKTNMTASGVGGGEPIGAKGLISMELTIGSKTLSTAFFIAETQGNFSPILGRDWIHAN